MTRTYKIKNAPEVVERYFSDNFKNCNFNFYWYWGCENGSGMIKVYGCEVVKNGEFYHNATQASLKWFKKKRREYKLKKGEKCFQATNC